MKGGLVIIGLAGAAGCGKTTSARYLEQQYGMACLAFADPVKRSAWLLHPEWTWEQVHGRSKESVDKRGISPRAVFQEIGSAGRRVHPDYWLFAAERTLAAWRAEQEANQSGVVWTDVRYDNEAAWVRGQGGLVVRLVRSAAQPVRGHESEAGIREDLVDYVVRNDGSLELLHAHLDGLVLAVSDGAGADSP